MLWDNSRCDFSIFWWNIDREEYDNGLKMVWAYDSWDLEWVWEDVVYFIEMMVWVAADNGEKGYFWGLLDG